MNDQTSRDDSRISTDPRTEWLSRLKLAAYLTGVVGVVVAAALANGCGPMSPSGGAAQTPAPSATANPTVVTPSPTSTPSPTPTPGITFAFDGTYGPGPFNRAVDSCVPPFFGASYSALVRLTGGGTGLEIAESQARVSSGRFNGLLGTFSGRGVVGAEPATWDDFVQLAQDASGVHAVVTETLRLTNRNDCGTFYMSVVLNKQP